MSGLPAEGTAATAKGAASHRLMMPALVFTTAAVVTVEFIVVGLLPSLARDLGVSLGRAGWLVSAFALSAALLGPLATLLAQRWPPRRVLAASLILFAAASLASAAIPAFSVLVFARVVQGALLTLFISLASAEAAALAATARAGRAVGQVNLGMVIGTVFLVPLGVALTDLFGWRSVFAGLGVFTFVGASLLPAVLPALPTRPETSPRCQLEILWSSRFLLQLLLSAVLFTAMFASYSYIAAYMEDVLGFSARLVAAALLGFGIAGLGGNWLAMRRVDRDPVGLTLAVTLVLVAATAALPLAVSHPIAALLAFATWGAAHTAAFVACQVRVMFAAPAAPAFAAALNISVCNLGIAVGAILGGWIIAQRGPEAIWLGPVIIGSSALALAMLLWSQSRRCL